MMQYKLCGLLVVGLSMALPSTSARADEDCQYAWSQVGFGLNSGVSALTVFDDGQDGGPALYAGGWFRNTRTQDGSLGTQVNYIASWDGMSWSPVGSGMSSGVEALTVFDDGQGPALYAAGHFTEAGGNPAASIARWNGSTWSPLGSGLTGPSDTRVRSMVVFDDGSGPALYAAGNFTEAGGSPASRIARWDGTSWTPLGSGLTGSRASALAVFDDGSGPALYVGGLFSQAGGMPASSIARWDGTSWSSLALGIGGVNAEVRTLKVFDDGLGGGPALYVGGRFRQAGEIPARNIARWDGSSWSSVGPVLFHEFSQSGFEALEVFDDGLGGGPALYAGGNFGIPVMSEFREIARWDGTSWSAVGVGFHPLLMNSPTVHALAVFDDGRGGRPSLYAGGIFHDTGDSAVTRKIARWGCLPTPCPCDHDGDGQQTMSDHTAFLTDFFTQLGGPGSADIDGDGIVTISDYFEFLNCLPAIVASEACP